jgi:hypothetical protein
MTAQDSSSKSEVRLLATSCVISMRLTAERAGP